MYLKFFFALAVFAAIVFLGNLKKTEFLKNAVIKIVSYPNKKILDLFINEKKDDLPDGKAGLEDLLDLRSQIEFFKRENEELKSLLLIKDKKNSALPSSRKEDFVLAKIVFRLSPENGALLIIDKGFEDGLKEGDIVTKEGKFVIGRIIETFENFSKVRLIADPDEKLSGRTLDSKISGSLSGNLGLTLRFDFLIGLVPQNDEPVLTSGEDDYPAGLIVGKIFKVESKENQSLGRAFLDPAVDFSGLEIVSVILNSK